MLYPWNIVETLHRLNIIIIIIFIIIIIIINVFLGSFMSRLS